ncbi:Na+/H+ antiporter NhaC [Virgibacillus phasianinus]|uniref:Na+/H+ antiporter NhaC n=1 Tax=Virgibacillus phasianinus TaxID=2017483 RepID=A0A220U2K6_9BACI|nr:Na+/H+ antiporter NhaC [Virgibacillus phasianinus]ASK62003.1 Na+/H+ antiporter NhaC [Virgibacillus phasianinus]
MEKSGKNISLGLALIPFLVMIVAMTFVIIVFEGSPHIPILLGAVVAAFIAWTSGYSWGELEKFIYQGITKVLPAVVILIMVGLIISAWIGGGIVTTMIYYGLEIISPSYFLAAILIICAIVTLMMGSSWSTIGTVGVAGMGIGISMGIPPAMIAGAIVSGAFFGDKMSPLSDTTILASGIAGAKLSEHIKHMLYTTVPAFIIALIVYFIIGMKFADNSINRESIDAVMNGLQDNFLISPWLLLIPLAVLLLVFKKVPALPALTTGIILGFLADIFFQGGSIGEAVNALQGGYSIDSGNETVDSLLNQGGLESMMYTVSLAMVAMIFGGIMESTGMLTVIVEQVLKIARTGRSLCATTVVSSFLTNVITAEQYISIIIPGRMYANAYEDKNLHPKNLSRALEDGGTITSALVPWSTDAVFVFTTLGVSAWAYAPYAVLNYCVPVISIIFSLVGFSVIYTNKRKKEGVNEQEENVQ